MIGSQTVTFTISTVNQCLGRVQLILCPNMSHMPHVCNIYSYIYHKFMPNVGKYSIYWSIWASTTMIFRDFLLSTSHEKKAAAVRKNLTFESSEAWEIREFEGGGW